MDEAFLRRLPRVVASGILLVAGIMAFMSLSEWPGLHVDAALFTAPVLNLANGEGWSFHGYLYRLTKVVDEA